MSSRRFPKVSSAKCSSLRRLSSGRISIKPCNSSAWTATTRSSGSCGTFQPTNHTPSQRKSSARRWTVFSLVCPIVQIPLYAGKSEYHGSGQWMRPKTHPVSTILPHRNWSSHSDCRSGGNPQHLCGTLCVSGGHLLRNDHLSRRARPRATDSGKLNAPRPRANNHRLWN